MKHPLLVMLGVLVLAGTTGFAWTWCQRSSAPVIVVPTTVNLGVQSIGQYLSFPIEVRNAGSKTLVLDQFRTSCGCLKVNVRRDGALQPIEELTMNVGETVSLWSGLVTRGTPGTTHREKISFRTNDPLREMVRINLVVELQGCVEAIPSRIELGEVFAGEILNKQFLIRDSGRKIPFQLQEVRSTSPDLVRVTKTLPTTAKSQETNDVPSANATHASDFCVTAPAKPGVFQGQLEVYEEGNSTPLLTVPVTGRVVPRFRFSPAALVLPRQSENGPMYSATSLCSGRPEDAFDLSLVSCPKGVKVRIEPQTASIYQIHIEASPSLSTSSNTSHKVLWQVRSVHGEERITLPVYLVNPNVSAPPGRERD